VANPHTFRHRERSVAIHFNINHGSFHKRFAPGGTGLLRRGFDLLAVTNVQL